MSENLLLKYRSREISEAIERARKEDAKHYYHKYDGRLVYRPCPFCGCEHYEYLEPYSESFGVAKCMQCLSQYVNPAPPKILLDDYYQNSSSVRLLSEFYSQRDQAGNQPVVDRRVERAIAPMIANGLRRVSVLEIGCNEGRFLERLRERGKAEGIEIIPYGIEPNSLAFERACNKGLCVKNAFVGDGPIKAFFNCKFDFVFCFELLEHLLDPYELLLEVNEILGPAGQLHLTTPNATGLENLLTGYNGYRQLAHAIAPPAHLNAFNTQNITHLAIRAGLWMDSVQAKGMFDAHALQEYVAFGAEDLCIHSAIELSRLDAETLQEFVNDLNVSSSMYVVMRKSAVAAGCNERRG